jgi:hypothetical protein
MFGDSAKSGVIAEAVVSTVATGGGVAVALGV